MYEITAEFYDSINAHVDYKAWADFIERIFEKYCAAKPSLVLDLGCGTGTLTLELARRGYDMTGADNSPEMLARARENADDAGFTAPSTPLYRRAIRSIISPTAMICVGVSRSFTIISSPTGYSYSTSRRAANTAMSTTATS